MIGRDETQTVSHNAENGQERPQKTAILVHAPPREENISGGHGSKNSAVSTVCWFDIKHHGGTLVEKKCCSLCKDCARIFQDLAK